MMLDWDGYRQELLKRIGDLGRLSPATVRGYRKLSDAGANRTSRRQDAGADRLAVGVTRERTAARSAASRAMNSQSSCPRTVSVSGRNRNGHNTYGEYSVGTPGQLAAILLERSLSDREHERGKSLAPSDADSAQKL